MVCQVKKPVFGHLNVVVKMILNSCMSFRPPGEIPQTLLLPVSSQGFLGFARNDMCATSCWLLHFWPLKP